MLVNLVLGVLILVNGLFAVRFVRDFLAHREETAKEPGSNVFYAIYSIIIWFLSTFGISDFAISTVVYRLKKLVPDKHLPGTLNTQCVIPVVVMALAYISSIESEPVTLASCLLAQAVGSYVTPRLVVKLPVQMIRLGMGCGLLIAAAFILAGKFHLIPAGGTAVGLEGGKLAIACVALFIFGGMNNIGVGAYAPTMATIYALGMNPSLAFPIMMGACSLSVPIGSMEFIRFGQYNRKPTLFGATFGIIGVLSAVYLVKSLDVGLLQWVVALVIVIAGLNLLYDALKKPAVAAAAEQ